MILFYRQETEGQVSGDDAGQQLQQDQAGLQDQGLQPGNWNILEKRRESLDWEPGQDQD